MTSAQAINELNKTKTSYTLNKIENYTLEFLVGGFIPYIVTANVITNKIVEQGFINKVIELEKDDEFIEELAKRVQHFNKLDCLVFLPTLEDYKKEVEGKIALYENRNVTAKPTHVVTSTTNYFLFGKH